jgi:hypothetical protein
LDGTVGAFPIGIAEAERAMTSPGWNALRVLFTKLNEILKTESRGRAGTRAPSRGSICIKIRG